MGCHSAIPLIWSVIKNRKRTIKGHELYMTAIWKFSLRKRRFWGFCRLQLFLSVFKEERGCLNSIFCPKYGTALLLIYNQHLWAKCWWDRWRVDVGVHMQVKSARRVGVNSSISWRGLLAVFIMDIYGAFVSGGWFQYFC